MVDEYSLAVLNQSDVAVPPHGVMKSLDVDYTTGLLLVTQPDVDDENDTSRLIINSEAAIPAGASGSGTRDFPAKVAYQADNENGADPQPGETWGPLSGSWYLHRGQQGFRIIGGAFGQVVNVTQAPPDPFKLPVATLTRYKDGEYAYTSSDPSLPTNASLPVVVGVDHVQIADGWFPNVYVVSILYDGLFSTVGGKFTVAEAALSPHTFAPTVSASTIQAALTLFTVTGSTLGTLSGVTPYTFTATTASTASTLVVDGTSLTPTIAHYPALTLNSAPLKLPVDVYLTPKSGGNPDVGVTPDQTGDGKSLHSIFTLTRKNLADGTFTFAFDPGATPVTLGWNDTASTMQTALSAVLGCTVTAVSTDVFTIEVTADYLAHTPDLDKTNLIGNKTYGVVWSNGTLCTGPIGGVDPVALPGYVERQSINAFAAVLTVGDGVATAASWLVTVRGAGFGGTDGAIVLDKGLGTQTSFPLRQLIESITVANQQIWLPVNTPTGPLTFDGTGGWKTNSQNVGDPSTFSQFIVLVTSDFNPHTIDIFTAAMLGDLVEQVVLLDITGCASLSTVANLPWKTLNLQFWNTFDPRTVGNAFDRVAELEQTLNSGTGP